MRRVTIVPPLFLVLFALAAAAAQQPATTAPPPAPGVRLSDVTWPDAEQRLKPDTTVVLPLGGGALQHGPHLKLGNDAILVEHLTRRTLDTLDVVVAPTIGYHPAAAFLDYPGSTSVSPNTARDLVADAVRSLAQYGPRRFYVLNVTELAHPSLVENAKLLAAEGILLRFTNASTLLDATSRRIRRQVVGSHADEIETSMMLFVDPGAVDMSRAVREYGPPSVPFQLTRRPRPSATFSASGAWGDPTLASRDKGRELVDALVSGIRADLEDLRRAALPSGTTATASARDMRRPEMRFDPRQRGADECLAGDERAIRAIGPQFYKAWLDLDAERLAWFWAREGDMVHPDGFIEGNAAVIRQNRLVLFARPEYKESRHDLTIGEIRCISDDVAIADAKWELRGVLDARRQPVPAVEGLCTLVLKRYGGLWKIDAYRYSMNSQRGPTVLQRPGMPEKNY
jgi:creatinine amidohydrolase